MKKTKKAMSSTLDSRTYRLAYYSIVSKCGMCSPHKGCNRRYIKREKNWKKFRKKQYK